ncbi:uncharacterized protein [Macrobrachium rosenbergii]|uniref:uncharacterized protein n=1 Tax=Macrobrachium rosenbergii TaxID=79674 RepID=UPI0034D4B4C0
MGTIEQRVLKNSDFRPLIYGRYIDDIFVDVRNKQELSDLQVAFQQNSCLRFTAEINNNGSLPFLDVMVTAAQDEFRTTVYTKETNTGMCLNANSEAPAKYMKSVINAYIHRAFTHCSSWTSLHTELERCAQVLVNNGYSNNDIQEVIRKKMDSFLHPKEKGERKNVLKLYYRNYMSTAYKTDEKYFEKL